jgi:hypothetical protein
MRAAFVRAHCGTALFRSWAHPLFQESAMNDDEIRQVTSTWA